MHKKRQWGVTEGEPQLRGADECDRRRKTSEGVGLVRAGGGRTSLGLFLPLATDV